MKKNLVKTVLSVILSVQLGLSGGITALAEQAADQPDTDTYQMEKKEYVSREKISAVTASSYQEGYEPEKAVDGIEDDENNCWHTPWSQDAPTFPHWIQVEFEEPQLIDSFVYVARSGTGLQFVTQYEIWTSQTTEDNLEKVKEGSWTRGKMAVAEFDPVSASVVRFVAKEKVDSNTTDTYSVSASEIKFGLSDSEPGAYDEKIQAALERAERVMAHASADCGTGQYQFKQEKLDALDGEISKLEALLGSGDGSVVNAQIRVLESAEENLLCSNKGEAEMITAPVPSAAMNASANSQNQGYEAEKAVDDNITTIWHSQWEPEVTKRPHNLTIDLGQSLLLDKITITPRQDMESGRISSGELYVGNDTENMVLAATFAAESTTDVSLNCHEGRYIQIRSLTGPDDHTAIAEVAAVAYDRGYTVLVNAYKDAMRFLSNAQVGNAVGQYPKDAVDVFHAALDEIQTEMEASLTNSECYELTEKIEEIRKRFAAKEKLYQLQDLRKLIQEAEELEKELKNSVDLQLLRDAIDHAKDVADNEKSSPWEIHSETVALKATVEGLRASGSDSFGLSGIWDFELSAYQVGEDLDDHVSLPGTLDENKKGHYNAFRDPRRLSRYYTYTGPAVFQRQVLIPNSWKGKDVTLFMERSRETRVWVNDNEVIAPRTSSLLAVSQCYDLTGEIQFGAMNTITIQVDNSYPNTPGTAITTSSMATEETQTNWNGIVGKFELRTDEPINIQDLRVYPNVDLQSVSIEVEVKNGMNQEYSGHVTVQVEGLSERRIPVTAPAGQTVTVRVEDYTMGKDVRLWSEFQQNLYSMTATLENGSETVEKFGMRVFSIDGDTKQLSNNGKKVFLRNEANCAVFPLTAYAPMDEVSWEKLFTTYQSYGLNSVRFHSWCPPDAAFRVADRMGMFLQPELSCWDPSNMFGDEVEKVYYMEEAKAIVREYANHPSFVMFTFGNELHFAGGGYEYADKLIQELKKQDSTRLYSFASNSDYGGTVPTDNSDFFTGQVYRGTTMRGIYAGMSGFINQSRPATVVNYNDALKRATEEAGIPAFSFEVGQFQVFPDVLEEIDGYTGVLEPRNLQLVEERLREKNISDETVRKYIEASGMLSRIGYRMEIEAALRTKHMSGISLLGIQDFSGQSTALVGMMNALGNPKPYDFANPTEFATFFSPEVALLETEKFVWTNEEVFKGKLLLGNYGQEDQKGSMFYCLKDGDRIIKEGHGSDEKFPQGDVTQGGELAISLADITQPSQLKLTVGLGEVENSYDIWVYPAKEKTQERDVYVTEYLDEEALYILEDGGKVLLSPKVNKTTLPDSITGTFTTAFWSSQFVSESQPGSMGLLMDPEHPVFDGFPTEYHSNYQWWAMAKLGRPMVLEDFKQEDGTNIQPLIQVLDSFSTVRTMGLLYEAKVGEGKLMVSSMGLDQQQATYPEIRALRNSIIDYMNSEEFNPDYELSVEQVQKSVIGAESDPRVNVAEKSNGGNVLLKEGTITCQEGYDNHPQDRKLELNDGRVDVEVPSRSWTDWNADKNYPDIEMTALFDKGYTVDTMVLPFFEDGGCKAPVKVKVEYLSGEEFVEVSNPSQTTGFVKGNNIITFDAAETKQIRITMEHAEGMAIALSEFIVYEKNIPAESIVVSSEDNKTSVRLGDTLQMGMKYLPENANDTSVRWTVLDEEGNKSSIAKISISGVLTPSGEGKVTVKAALRSDSQVYGTMDIFILPKEDPEVPTPKGNLEITITSEDQQVEGIKVSVQNDALNGEAYEKSFETDLNGRIWVEGIPAGDYEVSEVADNKTVHYVMPDGQKVTIKDGETSEVYMENKLIRGGFKVLKTDEDEKPLAGVRFGLFSSDGTKMQEFDTDKKGIYSAANLLYGEYYVKELNALKGYQLDEKAIYSFSVEQQGKIKQITVINKKVSEPGKKLEKEKKPPRTGDATDFESLLVMCGLSVAGLAGGILVYHKKKRW